MYGSEDLDPGFRVADEGELMLLKADVMKEVAQLFGNAAMNTQQVVTPALMQQMMQMIPENAEQKKNSDKPEEEAEPTDAALEEMSVLFAQGNFGEE